MKILDNLLNKLDKSAETVLRGSARAHGRRSFLARASALGGALLAPVLPFDRRAHAATPVAENDCTYWRHCAIDGFPASIAAAR